MNINSIFILPITFSDWIHFNVDKSVLFLRENNIYYYNTEIIRLLKRFVHFTYSQWSSNYKILILHYTRWHLNSHYSQKLPILLTYHSMQYLIWLCNSSISVLLPYCQCLRITMRWINICTVFSLHANISPMITIYM